MARTAQGRGALASAARGTRMPAGDATTAGADICAGSSSTCGGGGGRGRVPRRGDGAPTIHTATFPSAAARSCCSLAGARVVDASRLNVGEIASHRLRRLHRLHVDVPAGRHHQREPVHEAGRAGVFKRALATSACSTVPARVFKMTETRGPTAIPLGDRRGASSGARRPVLGRGGRRPRRSAPPGSERGLPQPRESEEAFALVIAGRATTPHSNRLRWAR